MRQTRPIQKVVAAILLLLLGYLGVYDHGTADNQSGNAAASDAILAEAFQNRSENLQVSGSGTVARLLPDDTRGSRHQRFTLRLASGQTLLVAHNIDLAPRVPDLAEGDSVEFFGEYEWNERGGVIHWTHHDPRGNHIAGWLKHRGQTYQ